VTVLATRSSHCSFADASLYEINPNQLQWLPLPLPTYKEKKTFVESLVTMGGYGDTCAKSGHAIHVYSCTESMKEQTLQNSDRDYHIVPQTGTLTIQTELGNLQIPPKYIPLVPRGIVFSLVVTEASRGYPVIKLKRETERLLGNTSRCWRRGQMLMWKGQLLNISTECALGVQYLHHEQY